SSAPGEKCFPKSGFELTGSYTISLSKDNKAARRRLRRRIADKLRKPTTKPTQLAEESEMVLNVSMMMDS
ncbi:MAG: hypothetical protein ABFD66_06025, partial [Smithella sp.]